MKLKNKTCTWQKCEGVAFRPWRTGVVPDGAKVDESIFEILDKKEEKKLEHKKTKKEIKE